jgi:hypothetical protein
MSFVGTGVRCVFSLQSLWSVARPTWDWRPAGGSRYDDPYRLEDWDQRHFGRCFVMIAKLHHLACNHP